MAIAVADIVEMRSNRVKLVHDSRAVLDKAKAEKRDLSSEEKEQWDQMMSDVSALKSRIDDMEKQNSAEDETETEDDDAEREEGDSEGESDDSDSAADKKKEDEDGGDRSLIRLPDGRLAQIVKPKAKRTGRAKPGGNKPAGRRPFEDDHQYRIRVRRNSPEYREAWLYNLVHGANNFGPNKRAIQADTDVLGGYLIAPQEFVATLIKFVDDLVYWRQKATKYVVASAQSLGAPSLDADPADSDWTSELAAGNFDSTMAFGKRELTPHPLAKKLKVSNKLLRMAALSGTFAAYNAGAIGNGVEGLVRARLGYKFAITEEKAFYLGNGAQQPLGVFVASARGISTARDVLTGSTTNILPDSLYDMKYSLKSQYQATAEWFFHRTAVQQIAKLKDGEGRYLWSAGLAAGQPDQVLNRPLNISEYVPNTFTTGQYVGLFGDPSFYWIADCETMVIQRLIELYAESNQTGFIARMELDGMPVLEEAFARLRTN